MHLTVNYVLPIRENTNVFMNLRFINSFVIYGHLKRISMAPNI